MQREMKVTFLDIASLTLPISILQARSHACLGPWDDIPRAINRYTQANSIDSKLQIDLSFAGLQDFGLVLRACVYQPHSSK